MAGVHQLHALGLAHTDIKVDNVFVDTSGVAFLDDLEYVVPVASPARSEGRGFRSAEQPAQEQDEAQLVLLQAEVLNL
jgi:serine/threonine protein kinase